MKFLPKILLAGLCLLVSQPAFCASPQTPWKSNQNGTLSSRTYSYNYTMGYRFTPQRNGQIVKLGGFFDGDKVVRLWDAATRQELVSTIVSGEFGQWRYADILPVDVSAGRQYIVAAYLGSGGSVRFNVSAFPRQFSDIVIGSAVYAPGTGMPAGAVNNMMFGQVDIAFVPADANHLEDAVHMDQALVRHLETIDGNRVRVTIDLTNLSDEIRSLGIVEEIPDEGGVAHVSHSGIIRDGRIEWLIGDLVDSSASGGKISYEISRDAVDGLNGYWISMEPRAEGPIGELCHE